MKLYLIEREETGGNRMIVEAKDNYIVTFTRDEEGRRIIDRCEDFKQYFYVGLAEHIIQDDRIINIELAKKKTLFGEEVKKITVRNGWDVSSLRPNFYTHFEADIPIVWRYWIDKVPVVPQEKLRKLYLDIETADMPDAKLDNQPITCIGFWDNYEEKYTTYLLDKENPCFRIEEREKHSIYYCPTEYVLLTKFIEGVRELDPDMMIAHNGDRFDFPVIVGRILALSVMGYGRLSSLGSVKRDNTFGEWKTKIGGRILFDFMGMKTNHGIKGGIRGLLDGRDITIKDEHGDDKIIRIKRWSLGYLAQFVGLKKGDYMAVQTLDEMIMYNTLDVKIMVELDKFFNVTEYYHNMQMLIGCPFEATYFNTNMIDFFLMKRYTQYVFPTKPVRGKFDNDATIEGALVDDPIQGLYKLLHVVDQTSLYPTVVVSGNMSPEKVDTEGTIILGNGMRFKDDGLGIVPDAVQFLLSIRLKYKKLAKSTQDMHEAQMYDLLSNGYKTLLVSFYGALLYKGFRLYNHAVAESIPYLGRVIKQHVRKIVEDSGYQIVAGDTDSSFLNPVRPDAVPIDVLVENINKSFDKFAADHGMKKHIFNIELDKTYSPIIMSDVKKRYVGFLLKGGKKVYKVTGWESVRRDTAPVTEFFQETVFKMILNGKSQKEVEEFVNDLIRRCISGEIPLSSLMLPKGFSKTFDEYKNENLWIRGVQYSNANLGTHFDHFSEIGAFHVKAVPEGKAFTDIVCVDEDTFHILNGYTIDWSEQLDKTIVSKFNNIKSMMGWGDLKQKTFGDYT